MNAYDIGKRIDEARSKASLSQRKLAERAGMAQATLSRTIAGERTATIPELLRIADATGVSFASLTGEGGVGDRVECAARSTNGSGMTAMRAALNGFMELSDYLDSQAIPNPGAVALKAG